MCPACGGIDRVLLAPGYWQCMTPVLEKQVVHDFNTGGPRSLEHPRPCATRYQEATPQTVDGPSCDCGMFAVGHCSSCQKPVCGVHGGMHRDQLQCLEHRRSNLEEVQRLQDAYMEEQERLGHRSGTAAQAAASQRIAGLPTPTMPDLLEAMRGSDPSRGLGKTWRADGVTAGTLSRAVREHSRQVKVAPLSSPDRKPWHNGWGSYPHFWVTRFGTVYNYGDVTSLGRKWNSGETVPPEWLRGLGMVGMRAIGFDSRAT